MSRQYWDRSEENRKYMRYVKLWQLKFENRKHSRIFMCKRCGKYIRVPKGKIQVICTACGDKTIHYTYIKKIFERTRICLEVLYVTKKN